MSIDIQMPALSPTMEEGTLAKWLVKEGDEVKAGDIIAEIETDKATMEVEAAEEGRVGKLAVAAGTENVPVGQVIAVLLEEGEDAGDVGEVEVAPAPTEAKETDQKAADESAPIAESKPESKKPESNKTESRKPVASKAPPAPKDDSGERVHASPLARRIAAQSGIDITGIEGSGPGGRIVKRDLEGKASLQKAEAAPSKAAKAPAAVPVDGDIPGEEVKLSAMRKVIAKRLTESKQTVPHFYLTVDVEMDALLALRKEVNEDDGVKISVNDFIIKAYAAALTRVPDANVQFGGDKLVKYSRADISVAVAIDGGLVTPVIRGAESKGVAAISKEMRDLAGKAREGKLQPEDYQGGTASISNLGMFGIKQFDAVINPPQATILAVGGAEQRPVVKDGQIVPATVMTVTLSCDHRAVDGAVGSELLAAFKGLVENPLKMLL